MDMDMDMGITMAGTPALLSLVFCTSLCGIGQGFSLQQCVSDSSQARLPCTSLWDQPGGVLVAVCQRFATSKPTLYLSAGTAWRLPCGSVQRLVTWCAQLAYLVCWYIPVCMVPYGAVQVAGQDEPGA